MKWLLQCNPIKWRIHDSVADGHEVNAWSVSRHLDEIGPDDDVALWLTGSAGGVVAVGHTTGPPAPVALGRVDDAYYTESPDPGAVRWAVPVRLTRVFLTSRCPARSLPRIGTSPTARSSRSLGRAIRSR